MDWSAEWYYESDAYAGFGPQAYLGGDTNPTTGTISGGGGGPFLLKSFLASTISGATMLSLTNNGTGESASVLLTDVATPVQVTNGWINSSTSVDVTVSDGYTAAFDDITYSR